jgi:thiamine pyrophosphokinase
MACVVISAGSITNYDYIKSFIKEDDFIICADGGLRHAEKMNVTPNLTVGDFDSWKGELHGEVMRFNPEKDYTDTHIAVREALERGFYDITLLGCTGTRLDHTISNIGLLEYIAKRGGKGVLVNEKNTVTVITKEAEFEGEKGEYISIIPIGEAEGVSIKNLKYSLDNAVLRFEESLAVSNEFIGDTAKIDVKKGSLIVIKSRD